MVANVILLFTKVFPLCFEMKGWTNEQTNKMRTMSHLSPGVSLISDLAHDSGDSGMLQSKLFTSRSQNLVLAKLLNSGFWRYGQFFKWNRVKMAKNGLKMVEFFWGASHMMNNNIFKIFCVSTFSFGYFTNPVFWPNLEKIALKTRSREYPKEKIKKTKHLKNVILYHMWAPQKKFNHF